ncbi:hypothetical protein GBF35_32665 [Nonomuraea phyllanthi]|uniref:hypothetical protein n=1 Tax=Nonomuraea phyllanthi TaxID=2219224 RepID=UPI0012938452|nr:hypothetical protein [Nonomuraea phyllanthi]QFY10728.1 hypothetical protein GBF35_32665 [Nonomuraea phyllanthi]
MDIFCDIGGAPDSLRERLDEYRRIFEHALAGRERTGGGIRFRFRARPGVEAWVRDLAARERACCAFFAFEVTAQGDEVLWDASVPDDAAARAMLEAFYALPETGHLDPQGLLT